MPRPARTMEALRDVLRDDARHDWSVADLQLRLAGEGVRADHSTIFRGLERLADQGEVERVNLVGGQVRYESRRGHHDHLVCEECGAVEAVPCAVVEAIDQELLSTLGFDVRHHQLVLTGACRRCRDRPGDLPAASP